MIKAQDTANDFRVNRERFVTAEARARDLDSHCASVVSGRVALRQLRIQPQLGAAPKGRAVKAQGAAQQALGSKRRTTQALKGRPKI